MLDSVSQNVFIEMYPHCCTRCRGVGGGGCCIPPHGQHSADPLCGYGSYEGEEEEEDEEEEEEDGSSDDDEDEGFFFCPPTRGIGLRRLFRKHGYHV